MNNSFQLGPVLPWGRVKGLGVRHQKVRERGNGRLLWAETQGKQTEKKKKNKVTICQAVCGG